MLGGGWGWFRVHWLDVGQAMRMIASAEGRCHGLMFVSKTCEIAKSSNIRGRPLLKILKSTSANDSLQRFSQLKFDGLK